MVEVGERYTYKTCGQTFELIQIVTDEIVNKRKKKLPEPLFIWKCINTSKTSTNRLQDVKRAISFKQWDKVK